MGLYFKGNKVGISNIGGAYFNGKKVWERSMILWSKEFRYYVSSMREDLNYGLAIGMGTSIVKSDSNGNEIWEQNFGGAVTAIEGDIYGNTYAGGFQRDLKKFDPWGKLLWAKQFGTSGTNNIRTIAISSNNDIYAGESNKYLTKFDSNGTQLWTKKLPHTICSLQTDSDYVYVGQLGGEVTKLSKKDGNQCWTGTFGTDVQKVYLSMVGANKLCLAITSYPSSLEFIDSNSITSVPPVDEIFDEQWPKKTISSIETDAKYNIYLGFYSGELIKIGSDRKTIMWERNLGEEIVSISSKTYDFLYVATKSKVIKYKL